MITASAASKAWLQPCPARCAVAPHPSTNQLTPKPGNAVNLRAPHDKFHPRRVRRYQSASLSVTARIHRSCASKLPRSLEIAG